MDRSLFNETPWIDHNLADRLEIREGEMYYKEEDLIYKDESYKIIGACLEVHMKLGCGYLEPVYQEALEYEFMDRNIPFEREKILNIKFKNRTLSQSYKADFVCYGKIIVELKALPVISSIEDAQVLNYLKITGYKLGLLINFGKESLEIKRKVL